MMRLAGFSIALALPALAVTAPANLSVPRIDPSESILSEYVPQAAPDPDPPPYTLLRYNERYDYLADPRNRTDFFDPIKYISLQADDPQSYLNLSGELRERYENFHNVGFGVGAGPHNPSYLLQRVILGADLHASQRLRFFVQAISGVQFGYRATAAPVNEDPLDLQQGFVDYIFGNPEPEGPRLTARAGRFEMTYGSGRFVATRAAPNIPLKFDGAQFIAGSGSARLYAFLARPVKEDRNSFDQDNNAQTFWGAYAVSPVGQTTVDVYYLGFRDKEARYAAGTGTELRQTIGLRLSGTHEGWSYDWEPVVQFGRFAGRDILAWTLATDTGYTFSAAPWRPRFGLKVDVASGDAGHPGGHFGAFNPLFFKAGYFNDASLIRPTNIVDFHPSLQFEPWKSFTATVASGVLWRYSAGDGVYGPSGKLFLPRGGSTNYLGTTGEAAFQWKANRHVAYTSSYVHFFADRYVKAAGGGDVDFVGAWVTFTL